MTHEQLAGDDPRLPAYVRWSGLVDMAERYFGSMEECATAARGGNKQALGLLEARSAEIDTALASLLGQAERLGEEVTGVRVVRTSCFLETDGYDGSRVDAYIGDTPIASQGIEHGVRGLRTAGYGPDEWVAEIQEHTDLCVALAARLPMPPEGV